jgi:hypothetical protein
MWPWVKCCADHIRDKTITLVERRDAVARIQMNLDHRSEWASFALHALSGDVLLLQDDGLFSPELQQLQTRRTKDYWSLDSKRAARLRSLQDSLGSVSDSAKRAELHAVVASEFLGCADALDMDSIGSLPEAQPNEVGFGMVVTICPNKGIEFVTGINSLGWDSEGGHSRCPFCDEMHAWNQANARIVSLNEARRFPSWNPR